VTKTCIWGIKKTNVIPVNLVNWWKKAEAHAAVLAKLHGISTKSMIAYMEHQLAIVVKSQTITYENLTDK
jgi:hypothetical protein